jgi:hypothetical protein
LIVISKLVLSLFSCLIWIHKTYSHVPR